MRVNILNRCKTCKFFERGQWINANGIVESKQLGGYCAVLDKIIMSDNNYIISLKRIYIQDTFGCVAHRKKL